jgi:hypothetical protein
VVLFGDPSRTGTATKIKGLRWQTTVKASIDAKGVSAALANRKPAPIEYAVYIARERLGRYVQNGPKKFKAFDADRLLSGFRVRAMALAAIRKAMRSARA